MPLQPGAEKTAARSTSSSTPCRWSSGGEFIGCFGIYQDITERIESEAKLRALRDRLTRVQDEERAHIARELHDDIGQRLALLTIQLAQLQKEARGRPRRRWTSNWRRRGDSLKRSASTRNGFPTACIHRSWRCSG